MSEQTDAYLKAHALSMWANYIETSDVTLSATDFAERHPARARFERPLLPEQMKLVLRLRKLAQDELTKDSFSRTFGIVSPIPPLD